MLVLLEMSLALTYYLNLKYSIIHPLVCIQVSAVDSDAAGLNSEVSYMLRPAMPSFFIINPVTGKFGIFFHWMSQADIHNADVPCTSHR